MTGGQGIPRSAADRSGHQRPHRHQAFGPPDPKFGHRLVQGLLDPTAGVQVGLRGVRRSDGRVGPEHQDLRGQTGFRQRGDGESRPPRPQGSDFIAADLADQPSCQPGSALSCPSAGRPTWSMICWNSTTSASVAAAVTGASPRGPPMPAGPRRTADARNTAGACPARSRQARRCRRRARSTRRPDRRGRQRRHGARLCAASRHARASRRRGPGAGRRRCTGRIRTGSAGGSGSRPAVAAGSGTSPGRITGFTRLPSASGIAPISASV